MDNKVNNITFGAKLVTKMHGRHGVIDQVAQQFEKRTASRAGELKIFRNHVEYPNAIIISLDNKKDYILHNYADLLGNKLDSKNDVTKDVVKNITSKFVSIFNALSEDIKFDEKVKTLLDEISSVTKSLKRNSFLLEKSKKLENSKMSDRFTVLVNQNKDKLEKLLKKYNDYSQKYLLKLEKMSEKEPILDVWASVVASDLT